MAIRIFNADGNHLAGPIEGVGVKKNIIGAGRDACSPWPAAGERPVIRIIPIAGSAYPIEILYRAWSDRPAGIIAQASTIVGRVGRSTGSADIFQVDVIDYDILSIG